MVIFAAASLFAAFADSSEPADHRSRSHGHRRRDSDAGDALDHRRHLPARHERAKAIAIWSATAGIGVPLGQIVGGALLEQFCVGVDLLHQPADLRVRPPGQLTVVSESRDPKARPHRPGGALLSTGTLSLFVFGIIEAPSRGWTDPLVVGSLVAVGGARARVRPVRAAGPLPDARRAALAQSGALDGLARADGAVPGDAGDDVPADAVPADRAGSFGAADGTADEPAAARLRCWLGAQREGGRLIWREPRDQLWPGDGSRSDGRAVVHRDRDGAVDHRGHPAGVRRGRRRRHGARHRRS